MTSQLRAILFDIDGTLIDTVSLIVDALNSAAGKVLGTTLSTEKLRGIIGIPLIQQIQAIESMVGIKGDEKAMTEQQFAYYEAHQDQEKLFEKAIEAVRLVKQKGYCTALVTSKNRLEMEDVTPRLELEDFVDTVVTSSDVAHPKPAPEAVLAAIYRLKVSPQEAIFIGDSIYDIICGKAAGVITAACAWGAATEEMLKAEKPDLFFSTPSQLLEWCESLPVIVNNASPEEAKSNCCGSGCACGCN